MQQVTWEQVGQTAFPVLSPAYKSNGHVFTSGCVGAKADGTISGNATEQTEIAIQNLESVLKASGSSLSKVLKVLLFVRDPEDCPAVNQVYAKYFAHRPARSCVIVSFPNKDVKVELECVAEYEESKTNSKCAL